MSTRGSSSRPRGRHRSVPPLWAIGGGVGVAALVAIAVFALPGRPRDLPAQIAAAVPTPSIDPAGRFAPAPSAVPALPEDLAEVIEALRGELHDTTDQLDNGSARLALWASRHLRWSALDALPATSAALFRKDPEGERGKRLCARGWIREVRAERDLARRLELDRPLPLPLPAPSVAPVVSAHAWRVPNGRIYFAVVDTRDPARQRRSGIGEAEPPLVLSAVVAGSTGKLVDGDPVRVCGVLTGVNLRRQTSGPDLLTHRVVGMFDLPENHHSD